MSVKKFVLASILLTALLLAVLFIVKREFVFSFLPMQTPATENEETYYLKANNPNSQTERAMKDAIAQCPAYKQAVKRSDELKAEYVSTKAISWYFEGYDKFEIAESLAALYNTQVARRWVEKVNTLSSYHEHYNELLETISSLEYNNHRTDFVAVNRKVMKSVLRKENEKQRFDLNERFNYYPDLGENHWHSALLVALESNDTEMALEAIEGLKTYAVTSPFFEHPLLNFFSIFKLSAFAPDDALLIVDALFDLAPVVVENNRRIQENLLKPLKSLKVPDESLRIEFISSANFEVQPAIKPLIDELYLESTKLQQEPDNKELCQSAAQKQQFDIETQKYDHARSAAELSDTWLGVKRVECAEFSFLGGIVELKQALAKQGVDLDNLSGFNAVIEQSDAINSALEELSPTHITMFHEFIFGSNKYTPEQISAFIETGISPENASFYSLIWRMPITEQKQMLEKYGADLELTNAFGDTIIALATTMTQDPEQMIPYLVAQGYPLKADASGIDPLWMMLRNFREIKMKNPVLSLRALIDNTEFDETHVNAMYTIKKHDEEFYLSLIDQFPELAFDAPESLVEFDCMDY